METLQRALEVKILKDLAGEISCKDVLVVEDIVDTGHTLKHVLQLLNSRNPSGELKLAHY